MTNEEIALLISAAHELLNGDSTNAEICLDRLTLRLRERGNCPVPVIDKSRRDEIKIQAIALYIELNLDKKLSVATLSKMAAMNRVRFTQQFKRILGAAPYGYVLKKRIELAKVLLKEGDMPLSEIALTCGFASQAHFATAFQKAISLSPRAWRRRHFASD